MRRHANLRFIIQSLNVASRTWTGIKGRLHWSFIYQFHEIFMKPFERQSRTKHFVMTRYETDHSSMEFP